MSSNELIELAERKSRQRAVLFAIATLVFLGVQAGTRPAFGTGAYLHGWRKYAWAFNAFLLLLCLGSGGGLFNSRELRSLIQDDVAQSNNRTACSAGFWVAMLSALVTYVVPAFQSFNGQQVGYIVLTASTAAALLTFSWLEYRAHAVG